MKVPQLDLYPFLTFVTGDERTVYAYAVLFQEFSHFWVFRVFNVQRGGEDSRSGESVRGEEGDSRSFFNVVQCVFDNFDTVLLMNA